MFEAIGGFFNLLMQPIYWAMSGIIVGAHWLWSQVLDPDSGWTWTLAIISLTIVIRTLMIPLFVRQINSSRAMQLVAPKARAIQEKYAHDRERAGQEVMKLYKDEGVNPAASCLPLVLQMPIFIGLFTVLNDASRGKATGFWLEQQPQLIDSLSNATIFGAPISATLLTGGLTFGPTFWVAAFLIISMTATLFVTQLQLMRKNMPPESLEGPFAQQQKMMLYLFPGIYLFTGVSFPIGVMIYWLASNLWTLGQQYLLIHNNPTPGTPAFVDWEDRMRAKGKDPAEIIRQRTSKLRRKKTGPVASAPGQVARQSPAGSTSSPAAPPSAGAPSTRPASTTDADAAKQRVQRQQPSKSTRANRKQARPRQADGPTKE